MTSSALIGLLAAASLVFGMSSFSAHATVSNGTHPTHIAFGESPVVCELDRVNADSPYSSAKVEFFIAFGQTIPDHGSITALAIVTGVAKGESATPDLPGQPDQLGIFLGTLSGEGFVSNTDMFHFNASFAAVDSASSVKLEGKDENGKWSAIAFPGGNCFFLQGSVGSHN